MTDIAERLRKENSMPPYYGVPKIQADAADEIERLRAALREIAAYKADEDEMDYADTVLEMNAIARAALKQKHD